MAELSARLRKALEAQLGARLVPARAGDPLDATTDYLARERACIERIAAAAGPDETILSPNFQSPVARRPGRPRIVNSVHDVQFLLEPRFFSAPEFAALVGQFQLTRDNADALLFLSEASRSAFAGFYGAGAQDHVIPPIIPQLATVRAAAVRREDFLLAVAHQEQHPHKNFAGLIALFAALAARKPTLRLVMTGHGQHKVEAQLSALAPDLRARIYHAGYVSRAALDDLFDRASAHVSLSLSEGFNMPAAEAAIRGTPLILSDLPAHRELFGDRALLVDPAAPSVDAVLAVLARPPLSTPWPHAARCAPATVAAAVAEVVNARERPSMSARPAAPVPITILFAQELGGGFGHVAKLIAIARHFPHARRVFILREPKLTAPVIHAALGTDIVCLQAPDLPGRMMHQVPERDMADILFNLGYGDAAALAITVGRWRVLADGCRPDLVVSDFAPSVRIALAGHVPHVAVGTGFTMVPDVSPLPPFRAHQVHLSGEGREDVILAAGNAVRARLALAPLVRAAALFGGDRAFCTGLTCLDPFAAFRTQPLIPPLGADGVAPGPALSQRSGPDIFCYFDATAAALNPLLTALNAMGRPTQVYVRNIDPAVLAPHCAPHVAIHTRPAIYRDVLPQTRLLIHCGMMGTAVAGLLAGTPQLVLPNTLERQLVAGSLLALGVAGRMSLQAGADVTSVRVALERVLGDDTLGNRAADVAADLARFCAVQAPEAPIVAACRELITAGQQTRRVVAPLQRHPPECP